MKFSLILLAFISTSHFSFGQEKDHNAVIKQLLEIDKLDQQYRNQIDEIQNRYGGDSKEMKLLFSNMKETDSADLVQIDTIIKKYGWLGYNTIGEQANTTIFMVIQHSDLSVQLKYLPLLREAVKIGNAKARHLALLEDREALRQGKKQIYGSQMVWNMKTNTSYIAPLEDPANVDKRRVAVGLQPLSEYLASQGIKWNLEQYKKDLFSSEKDSLHLKH